MRLTLEICEEEPVPSTERTGPPSGCEPPSSAPTRPRHRTPAPATRTAQVDWLLAGLARRGKPQP